MDRTAKIHVAGHRGLVGSALVRRLESEGFTNLLLRGSAELDLTDQPAVDHFYRSEQPEYVFLAAARVGGIQANSDRPGDFIRDNLAIQTNVIHASMQVGVRRLLFLGSSCIYPRDCPQPIREEYLLTGPLEPTNRSYAIAKIAGIEMCRAYNYQHGTRFLAAMPTNLYGTGDNYQDGRGHVIPALLKRFRDAAARGEKEVIVWGTGKPLREFLYSDDLADALVRLMQVRDSAFDSLLSSSTSDGVPLVNIGSGEEISIADLAVLVAKVTEFQGRIQFDAARPDGTPRKLLDSTTMRSLGWEPSTSLHDGLHLVLHDIASDG